MKMTQMIAVCAAVAMLAAFVLVGQVRPAQAHDVERGEACSCNCQRAVFPPTENIEVAQLYVRAHLITLYMEQHPTVTTQSIESFMHSINNELD